MLTKKKCISDTNLVRETSTRRTMNKISACVYEDLFINNNMDLEKGRRLRLYHSLHRHLHEPRLPSRRRRHHWSRRLQTPICRNYQNCPACLNINPPHMQHSVFATPSGGYSCKKKDRKKITCKWTHCIRDFLERLHDAGGCHKQDVDCASISASIVIVNSPDCQVAHAVTIGVESAIADTDLPKESKSSRMPEQKSSPHAT